jgi:hypothetical protein
MNLIPKDVTIRMEQRKVAIRMENGYERLGIFHKWTELDRMDYALIENTDGGMEYIPMHRIRFLPMDNAIPLNDLADTLRKYGVLRG